MSLQLPLDQRRIIPRWRYSKTTLATGELIFSRVDKENSIKGHNDFNHKLQRWTTDQTIESAAEVVSSGLAHGLLKESLNAVRFLFANEQHVSPSVLLVANELLIRSGESNGNTRLQELIKREEGEEASLKIRIMRKALSEYPRNPIMWVDMSRAYIVLGQTDKAKDAMKTALFLAPENRFVLRSAARLFVHVDEPDHAHGLLLRSNAIHKDPWLLAAEIAVANVADITPKYVKNSRDILDRKIFHPFHTAELTSAIASIEFLAGANRKARKLFESSLISPTENSVAQSVWVKRWLPTLNLGDSISATPRTYEAKAWNSYFSLDWSGVVRASTDWLLDEPFSSRPALLGSYAASMGLNNFVLAEKIARSGLVSNPGDPSLINNYAFALASQNKLVDAREILQSVSRPVSNRATEIALMATEGMIDLRSGNYDEGRRIYLDAVSIALQDSLYKVATLASIFYALEMNNVGELSKNDAIQFIEKASLKTSDPEIKWLIEKLKKEISV